MPDREIHCARCGVYLGVLRDAKLRKDIMFGCGDCFEPKSSEEANGTLDYFSSLFGARGPRK